MIKHLKLISNQALLIFSIPCSFRKKQVQADEVQLVLLEMIEIPQLDLSTLQLLVSSIVQKVLKKMLGNLEFRLLLEGCEEVLVNLVLVVK